MGHPTMQENDTAKLTPTKNQGKTKKNLVFGMEFSFFLLKMIFPQPLFLLCDITVVAS